MGPVHSEGTKTNKVFPDFVCEKELKKNMGFFTQDNNIISKKPIKQITHNYSTSFSQVLVIRKMVASQINTPYSWVLV